MYTRLQQGEKKMKSLMLLAIVIAVYFLMQLVILPRLGIST